MPQVSVLSPILFNICTNGHPLHDGTHSFIYADDLCITAQYSSFTEVESTIGDALDKLTQYYRSSSLRANPDNTQVTAFYLRGKRQTITKSGMEQDRPGEYPHPKYLGVTLDRTLATNSIYTIRRLMWQHVLVGIMEEACSSRSLQD